MLFPSNSDRESLLCLARLAITEVVSHGEILAEIPTDGIFSQTRGVFVSLHIGKRLRGCIGVVDPRETLGNCIVRCAAGAALHDPRFPPVRLGELSLLHVEMSLLSTPLAIRPEEIEIGRHGLLISRGNQRGVLLPQVAVRHRLDAEQFLAETCKKAQLAPDAWREAETNVLGFTCEIFSSAAPETMRPATSEVRVPLATQPGLGDKQRAKYVKLTLPSHN